MLINEDTELDGKILCLKTDEDGYYHCYTFKLRDVEKVIRYCGDIHTYYTSVWQYPCCRGSNIRVPSNEDSLYTEALIKLKNGLYLISYISFELFEEETFELNKVNFLPYFKKQGLYEERSVTNLSEDIENFMMTSNKIYKANSGLYSYRCPSYKCSNSSRNEKDNETILNIKISENNIEKFDYVTINGIKFKKDKGE